jgi:hypothetical protein
MISVTSMRDCSVSKPFSWEAPKAMILDKIRPITEEELAPIASTSDMTPMSKGIVFKGIKAIYRICNEIDPVYFGDATDRDKIQFMFALQHLLMGNGATEFYFNVAVDDEAFQKVLESLGATRTSEQPEYRYKVSLI